MQTTTVQPVVSYQSIPSASLTQLFATPGVGVGYIFSAMTFCNKTTSPCWLTLSIFTGSTNIYIVYQQVIAPLDTLIIGGENAKLTLTNGLYYSAQAQTAASLDFTGHYVSFS